MAQRTVHRQASRAGERPSHRRRTVSRQSAVRAPRLGQSGAHETNPAEPRGARIWAHEPPIGHLTQRGSPGTQAPLVAGSDRQPRCDAASPAVAGKDDLSLGSVEGALVEITISIRFNLGAGNKGKTGSNLKPHSSRDLSRAMPIEQTASKADIPLK